MNETAGRSKRLSIMRALAVSLVLLTLRGCGGTQAAPPAAPPKPPVLVKRVDLRELEHAEPPKLLAIDWSTVSLQTSADAHALWARIAPTGLDWEDKLGELPEAVERPLAIALIEGGNFACMPPPSTQDCAPHPLDVRDPAPTAGLTDPCLRRLLAIWALDKLEAADLPKLRDPLRAIVAIPPPESELVATALAQVPEDDHALRLDLVVRAHGAGQHDVVSGAVGRLDEAHLIAAVTQHHVDAALEILSAEAHRSTYLAAATDERLAARTRTRAMLDLVATPSQANGKLAPDVKAALVKAAAAKDCTVAASAARLLQQAGDKRFVPTRPRTRSPEKLMRSLCVLASYEQQQAADEVSLLPGYVRAHGLERITITYDPLGETDDDGDGNPHTRSEATLVTKDQLVLPEIDDLVLAMKRCTGTVCQSEDRAFRFTFKSVGGQLLLSRLEMADRPPCPKP